MTIKLIENNPKALYGYAVVAGYTQAFNEDTKTMGVVQNGDKSKFLQTLPLNGHRARNLAEEVFGNRSAGEWSIGRIVVVPVQNLMELPAFDGRSIDHIKKFKDLQVVTIEVVMVDPSYGVHIAILDELF
jgi:hypothetical protein